MIDPVLEKNIVVEAGVEVLVLGDAKIDYNHDFRLYLTTKIGNPAYTPEVFGKTMIIYDPRVDQKLAGTRRDEMVLSIDLAPTLLALAGLVAPQSMQGKSMVPMVKNESVSWRQHFYYEHTYQTERPRSPIPKTEGIRTTRWKYIRYPDIVPVAEQLFDLENDPLERKNLASIAEHSQRLAELRELCENERKTLR